MSTKQITQDISNMTDDQLNAYIRNLGGMVFPDSPRWYREETAKTLESRAYHDKLGQYLRKRPDAIQDV